MNDGIRRTAYGYTRVFTDEQVPGASLQNQRIAIQRYADENEGPSPHTPKSHVLKAESRELTTFHFKLHLYGLSKLGMDMEAI